MCRTDGEPADVYNVVKPIARKEHRCGECGRTILRGEPYERHSMVYDGSASTHAVCEHCAVLTEWLVIECGGTITHEMISDIEEHAQEYRRSDLAELATAARGKWESFRGKPLPAIPPRLSMPAEGKPGEQT